MKILLFGVSCVGKSTVGEILAKKLGYKYFDLDDEVKKYFNTTIDNFVNTGWLYDRDMKRGEVLRNIIHHNDDLVLAVTPVYYITGIKRYIQSPDFLRIELYDSPENIFERIIYTDENDEVYDNEEYKQSHRKELIREIKKDITCYGAKYKSIGMSGRFNINGDSAEAVADRLITEYNLKGGLQVKIVFNSELF
jgi:shikimate kinase